MTRSHHFILLSAKWILLAAASVLSIHPAIAETDNAELSQFYRSQIPKTEIGVPAFLEAHPTFDGRDVVIAVFDTSVDPGAPGMQVTTTGERKIVDIIDASGAGDVDISTTVEADKNGYLKGLTGRTLLLPKDIQNPDGVFHIGVKYGKELFHEDAWGRVTAWRKSQLKSRIQEAKSQRLLQKHLKVGVEDSETPVDPRDILDKTVLESELDKFEQRIQKDDPGPYYDCVVWNDGKHWRVLIDTDEDSDLNDEKPLRSYKIAGEYADFPDYVAMNFGVAVYHDGNLLSIITTSGSHGTHVASIAQAISRMIPILTVLHRERRFSRSRLGIPVSGGHRFILGKTEQPPRLPNTRSTS
jgi:tripeptidyl-peptidase II